MEMMAEAPILSIIPGKANFLPDLTDDQKKEFVESMNETLKEMNNRFTQNAQDMLDSKNADMRLLRIPIRPYHIHSLRKYLMSNECYHDGSR